MLPLENLSDDFSLDWIGRAAAETLVYDLAGSPDLYSQVVESASGAQSMRAARVLQGYFVSRNGRIELHATLSDARKTTNVGNIELGGALSSGPLPLLNQLAKRLSPSARSYSTGNAAAFRDFGGALGATDRAEALRGFQAALAADPRFSTASLAAARLLSESGDREQALKVLESAGRVHPASIDAARLRYLAALIGADTQARLTALDELMRATPADSQVFREAADLRFSQRKFTEAVRSYEAVTRLDPEEAQTWNQLGYAAAFAQDLAGARRALEHYRLLLPPEEANPLDSLGEVSFYLGDFSGAVKYFVQAHDKNPAEFGGAELLKAAQAQLLAGNLGDADGLFRRYIGLQQHAQGAVAEYQNAQWDYLTGRRKAAMSRLDKLNPSLEGDAKALALCQLSLWNLEAGDSKAAADLSAQAEASARNPRLHNLAAMCRFFSTLTVTSSGSPAADAYARLFERKFAEALPLLESIYRETNPTLDGQIRILLAWAYVETGRWRDAAGLLELRPIPLSSGEPLFASLIFPRYLYLRGTVLEKEGKRAEAKRSYELFLKYAGDRNGVFGDQAKARERLAAL